MDQENINARTGSVQHPLHLGPPINIKSMADAKKIVQERNLSHIKIGITDLNGVMRSKYISKDKFFSVLENGFGFCDVIVGGDIDDQLISNMQCTGWHSGYPDATVQIIPESARELPFEPNTLLFLCEFAPSHTAMCARQVLKRVVNRANKLGFYPKAGMEFEFSVFAETPQSCREKNYQNLTPITPGNFGYSLLRTSVLSEFYDEVLQVCETMNLNIEGLHTEIGPGVLEAAIAVDTILEAADKAALFKNVVKILAQRRGWMATFMAKWSNQHQGQSGHIHLSMQNSTNENLFYAKDTEHTMSSVMQYFVAGQQQLMPEFLAMVAPFINSYVRLVPGFWAPTQATWGVDNRTCALRVISGSPKSQRIEYRIPAADCNPYLGMAAALASGLWGIEQQATLSDPCIGNAYEATIPPEFQLPATLEEAAEKFRQSKVAADYFGQAFVDDYARTRTWEVEQSRKAITDWQLARYFEIV